MEHGLNDKALLTKLKNLIRLQETELDRLSHALTETKEIATRLDRAVGSGIYDPSSESRLLHILLIEDDELARLGANSTFSDISCEIIAARSKAQAIELLKKQSFDIIFCDMNLPDGNGIDVVDYIKRDGNGLNARTPIIALTADNDKSRQTEAEQHGFDLYLVKPLTQESAKAVIDVYAFNLTVDIKEVPEQTDSLAVVDLDQAEIISGGDKKVAMDLIGRLIDDFPAERASLAKAYQTNDIASVRETLHRLKGGASYCGVPQLKAAIRELWDQVNQVDDLHTIESSFSNLYRELDAVKRVYETLLQQQKAA